MRFSRGSGLLFLVFVLWWQGVQAAGFRKYAGEFMAIDVSPRAQAMGGAYGAVVSDVTAGFYNPAALAQVKQTQVAFMHTWQFANFINYDYVGFARPLAYGKTLGLALIRLGVDNIKDTRAALVGSGEGDFRLDLSKVRQFNAADYVLFISLGQQVSSRLLLGINAKFIRRNLADHSANGLGFDAAALFTVSPRFRVSAMLRNITSTLIAWDTGEKELVRPTMSLGSAYVFDVPGMPARFTPSFELLVRTETLPNLDNGGSGFNNSGIFTGIAGGELLIQDVLAFRAGVDELQRASFGVGLHIPHLFVDYSFTSFDQELGNSHRVGLVINFGS